MAMKSLILVDFLGIERLTNSFGLLLMFQGFAVMLGPPLSGNLCDLNYDWCFIEQGYFGLYLISVLLVLQAGSMTEQSLTNMCI